MQHLCGKVAQSVRFNNIKNNNDDKKNNKRQQTANNDNKH